MSRALVVLRGIPGSGKSTFVSQKGLDSYVISPDHIRLLTQSPRMTTDGGWHLAHEREKQVWQLVMEHTEKRMEQGDFIVIDATHNRARDINVYRTLAHEHRYRVVCVDFSAVPLDTCLERNQQRTGYQRVPDDAIRRQHERILSSSIPEWVTTLTPDAFDAWFASPPWEVGHYTKIHHIGDIHGCDDALARYLGPDLKDDELYIFVGDYLDRGIQNAEVLDRLLSIRDRPNVIFLEGNHERHLKKWANDERSHSRDFERYTRPQLEDARISQKAVRLFASKWHQFAYYHYHGKEVLVSHGGVATIPDSLYLVSTEQFIRGVGDYDTLIDEAFTQQTHDHQYQIHGHRNKQKLPIFASSRSFNLEGQVETGGCLRVVTLDENGFTAIAIQNDIIHEKYTRAKAILTNNGAFMEDIRSNKMVREEKQGHTNISSFTFKKNVFFDATWDAQTLKARGLFINTHTTEITARSYDKFFNWNERADTQEDALSSTLVFPVRAYEKANGFLGICGYDTETGELVLASKSKMYGRYAAWFKELFYQYVPPSMEEALKSYLQEENVTLTFEVIDPVHDPHIIEYDRGQLILLDVVKRTPAYEKLPFETVQAVGGRFGLPVKTLAGEWSDWASLRDWIQHVTTNPLLETEGYVVEDESGFLFKLKCPYYTKWKRLRSLKERLEKGLETPHYQNEDPSFLGPASWLSSLPVETLKQSDIITLRNHYNNL